MTKRSPRTKRSSSGASRSQGAAANRNLILVAALALLILVGYFLLTGSDPLGLFSPIEMTPVPGGAPTAPAGAGGSWWQVYFTDPHTVNDPDNARGSIPEKLIDRISKAQRSIHIAAFEFDLTPVAEALVAAHRRGVEVQWITDDENGLEADEDQGHGQFAMLDEAGIDVRDDGRGALMHNKFVVFDDQTVWTGSTNITVNDSFRNNNNVIMIESPEVAAIYEREFAEMWSGKYGPASPSMVDSQRLTIAGTPVQILFAPEDEVIGRLVLLIEGAQSSIRFMAFSFTHNDLAAAVLARADAGVDVRGIFETRGSETQYSALGTLYCAGVPVRQDGNPGTFHHKVFVIDDKTVITGSLNFSQNADESNDENVVVITNPDIAAQYIHEFERRWAEATEPNRADFSCR